MNYLILCPQYVDSESDYYTFPVGIAYVNASLKLYSESVFQLNLNYRQHYLDDICESIVKNSINCVIIGGTSLLFNHINQVTTYIKLNFPQIVVIVGGGIITAAPYTSMTGLQACDIGIIGEGEYTIQDIARALENEYSLESIKGIIFRSKNGEIKRTEHRPDIADLDSLPFPDYNGFDYERLISNNRHKDEQALQVIGASLFGGAVICTSRSCPYNCSFCFHTCGTTYRQRSLDNVFEEIDWLIKTYNIQYLNILDELFGVHKERLEEFCRRIKPYNLIWRAGTRVDQASFEAFEMMRDSGCRLIGFGIESANNKVLKQMNKHITIEQINNAFLNANLAGISTTGVLLLGDNNESMATFKDTIEFYKTRVDLNLMWSRIIILPGSKLYRIAFEGKTVEEELEYWKAGFPFINITQMTDEEFEFATNTMESINATRQFLPLDYKVENINYESRIVALKITCTKCQCSYNAESSEFFGDHVITNACPRCGQVHSSQLYSLFKREIDEMLAKYLYNRKLYIYGAGHEVRKLLKQSNVAMNEDIIIVDRDVRKQKNGFEGKKIHSPELLKDMELDFVINGGGMSVHKISIENTIINNYLTIKSCLDFNTFLFDLIFSKGCEIGLGESNG